MLILFNFNKSKTNNKVYFLIIFIFLFVYLILILFFPLFLSPNACLFVVFRLFLIFFFFFCRFQAKASRYKNFRNLKKKKNNFKMADNYSSPARSSHNLSQAQYSGTNLKVIKTDIAPTGEAIQLVRPMLTQPDKSTADIVGELVSQYDYKSKELVKASQ
jgi:Ca2+/Na+ antiporter